MIWFGDKRPEIAALTAQISCTMHEHLGMEPVDCGDDWLRIRMPVDDRTRQPFGRLHGGASAALAETAASMAANLCVDPDQCVVVGMELNANHVRAVRSGWVTATARPESLGNKVQVWSIRIEDIEGKLVCIARMTGAVIGRERR